MCFKKKLPPAVPRASEGDFKILGDEDKLLISNAKNLRIYRVTTKSMKPLLAIGSYGIITQDVDVDKLVVGNDLVFEDDEVTAKGIWVLHRIIEVGSDELGWKCRTQGLNNNRPDKGWRRENEIKGRLIGAWSG
jgi:signal peptidase I